MRKEGQFLVEDFYANTGGLNTADSPFVVDQSCSTGGQNYDYAKQGGFQKRAGHTKLNTTADTQLKTLGLGIWNKPGTSLACIRAAGQKIQKFDLSSYTCTDLSEDTVAAGGNFFAAASTQPVVSSMFNTPNAGVLWHAGGGLTEIYGAYSATKVTKNGVAAPTVSAFTATSVGSGGILPNTTVYKYSLAFRKLSTQAISNCLTTVEASVTTTSSSDSVTLAWTITNNDTTKYDKIYVYRSSAGGSTGFTAGVLVTTVASSATGATDTGTVTESGVNVPRAGSSVLDNSVLPVGTYNSVTTWKQRLVAATGSTVYISDINKPESFPTINAITVPSGGNITGVAIINSSTPVSATIDEILCIFKQSEVWVITGTGVVSNSLPDLSLKYIANTGTAGQSLVVPVGGDLFWTGYRGVFTWNGNGKPVRLSKQIKDLFERNGDIDKSLRVLGFGVYAESRNEAQWYLSSKTLGAQKYVLKLDLALPMEGGTDGAGQRELAGKFTPDILKAPIHAGVSFIQSSTATEATELLGDALGYIFNAYTGTADGGSTITMQYLTSHLHFGMPSLEKRLHRVVAWCLDSGSYDLNLSVWSKHRFNSEEATVLSLSPSSGSATGAVWDASVWDSATFDSATNKVKPLTYNIPSSNNNNEGDSFRLQFSESSNQFSPVVYGFSVYFTSK